MGVDTKVYLARGTDIEHVADACSILLGHEPTPYLVEDRWNPEKSFYVTRTNGKVTPGSEFSPDLCRIVVPQTDEAPGLHASFFIAGPDATGLRANGRMYRAGMPMIFFGARPERMALAKRLVDFFGGEVDYNDCDSEDRDHKARGHRLARPKDEDYVAFHAALFMLRPLSEDDIAPFDTPDAPYRRG